MSRQHCCMRQGEGLTGRQHCCMRQGEGLTGRQHCCMRQGEGLTGPPPRGGEMDERFGRARRGCCR